MDLRTDTVTQPTEGMRAAMANAVVGDEQKREDPTVIELEERVAALLEQEEAVFLPSATMANQIALHVLTQPSDELLAEATSHILRNELGGPAFNSGLMVRGLPGEGGRLTSAQIRAAFDESSSFFHPGTRLVCIENSHNASGGRVWKVNEVVDVAETCRELGLAIHLDGARLLNAAVATGEAPSAFSRECDTVTLCLSKGLGCPVGALIAGSAETMVRARRAKHLFGGAMRQAGILAAAGLYALDHHVERLADDHARAKRLAAGLSEAGVPVEIAQVETNFVLVEVGKLGLTKEKALSRLQDGGVLLSGTVHKGILRAVTHLDVTDEQIDYAIEVVPRALDDGAVRGRAANGVNLQDKTPLIGLEIQ